MAAPGLAVNSQEEMRQRIRNERAYELPAEGHRYWDLRRWGIYGPTVKNATDIYGDLMFTREYQPRHELWPIPQVELERNIIFSTIRIPDGKMNVGLNVCMKGAIVFHTKPI